MNSHSHDHALRHHAFVYDSDDDYVTRSRGFLKAGLDAGEGAVVAGTRGRITLLREEFGPLAEQVSFIDVSGAYTRPARTIAAYHSALLAELRRVPSARVVAEVQYGRAPAEWDEWAAYEAITNAAHAHLPAWVVCTYNSSTTPDQMLDAVWQTHKEVLTDEWQASSRFEDPAAVVRRLTPEPQQLPGLRSLPPGADLESFRERLAGELSAERVPHARALDMLVAATEVARNAIQHGSGLRELRVGQAHGRFVCEISDRGSGFDDPLAGYMPPRNGQARSGLWIARQLAWRLELIPSSEGLTVRIWI